MNTGTPIQPTRHSISSVLCCSTLRWPKPFTRTLSYFVFMRDLKYFRNLSLHE